MHQHDTIEREPWEVWGLTPYQPDPEPAIIPPVALCVSEAPPRPQIVAYAEVTGKPICDHRMTVIGKRERGKFGLRSAISSSVPCQRRAVVIIEFDDETYAYRCKEHAPGKRPRSALPPPIQRRSR